MKSSGKFSTFSTYKVSDGIGSASIFLLPQPTAPTKVHTATAATAQRVFTFFIAFPPETCVVQTNKCSGRFLCRLFLCATIAQLMNITHQVYQRGLPVSMFNLYICNLFFCAHCTSFRTFVLLFSNISKILVVFPWYYCIFFSRCFVFSFS